MEIRGRSRPSDRDTNVGGRWWGGARRRRGERPAFALGVSVDRAPAPFDRTKVSVCFRSIGWSRNIQRLEQCFFEEVPRYEEMTSHSRIAIQTSIFEIVARAWSLCAFDDFHADLASEMVTSDPLAVLKIARLDAVCFTRCVAMLCLPPPCALASGCGLDTAIRAGQCHRPRN